MSPVSGRNASIAVIAISASLLVSAISTAALAYRGYIFPHVHLDRIASYQHSVSRFYILWLPLTLGTGFLLSRRSDPMARNATPLPAVLCFLGGAAFYFPFTNDDALILSRFAVNMARGEGIAFNPGEQVEGFTCLAWGFLCAAAGAAGLDVVVFAKILGILLASLAILLVYGVCRRLAEDDGAGFACSAILASSQLFQSWAGSGMDVSLFFFWECLLAYVLVTRRKADRWTAVTCATGFLIRPEAYFIGAIAWIWLLAVEYREGNAGRTVPPTIALAAAAVAPFLFRQLYFGSILPNTYYAKSYFPVQQGVRYLLETAQYFGWPFLGICVAGCLILSRRTAWPMVVLAAYAAYLVSVGGDILSLRFSTFLYPYLLIGLATLLAWIPPLPGKVRPFYGIFLPVAVCLALGIQGIFRMDSARTERFSQVGHLYVPNNSIGTFQADYPAARFLAMGAMKNDLLATDNIGAVGYYSGLRILDSAGIANKPVAMLLAARRFGEVGEHIRASSPDWILCYPYMTHKGEGWWMLGAGDITRWVRGNYHPVRYWQSITGYTRVLLKKNR